MTMPRTEEEIALRADELDCAPVVVPVVERLDRLIVLLEWVVRSRQGGQLPDNPFSRHTIPWKPWTYPPVQESGTDSDPDQD